MPAKSTFQDYLEELKDAYSDLTTDLSLFVNAVAVCAFLVALFVMPISSYLSALLTFYEGVRNNVFRPVEWLFGFQMPPHWKDFLIIWTTLGLIGARTMLRLNQRMHRAVGEALQKAQQSEARRFAIAKMGQKKFDEEEVFLKGLLEHHRVDSYKKRVLYIGCILTGPLFFAQIWRVKPPLPDTNINGRTILLLQMLGLATVVLVFFVFSWVTP